MSIFDGNSSYDNNNTYSKIDITGNDETKSELQNSHDNKKEKSKIGHQNGIVALNIDVIEKKMQQNNQQVNPIKTDKTDNNIQREEVKVENELSNEKEKNFFSEYDLSNLQQRSEKIKTFAKAVMAQITSIPQHFLDGYEVDLIFKIKTNIGFIESYKDYTNERTSAYEDQVKETICLVNDNSSKLANEHTNRQWNNIKIAINLYQSNEIVDKFNQIQVENIDPTYHDFYNLDQAQFAQLYQEINTKNLNDLNADGIPNDYCCPVTQELMTDPVCILGSEGVEQWIDKKSFNALKTTTNKNPFTQAPLELADPDTFGNIKIIAYGKVRERMKDLVHQLAHDPQDDKNIFKIQIALFGLYIPDHQHIMYFLEHYDYCKNIIINNEIPGYVIDSRVGVLNYIIANDTNYKEPNYLYNPDVLNQKLWWTNTGAHLKVPSIAMRQQNQGVDDQPPIRRNHNRYSHIGGGIGFFLGAASGFGLPFTQSNWVNSNLLGYVMIGVAATVFGTIIGSQIGKCKQNRVEAENLVPRN